MEIMEISQCILEKIKLLEKMRGEIRKRSIEKSNKKGLYDKIIAVTIIQLKNGKVFELDGELISGEGLPGNLIEKISKGLCWKELIEMDESEFLYKSLISNIETVQTELQGYQSINRYLDNGVL